MADIAKPSEPPEQPLSLPGQLPLFLLPDSEPSYLELSELEAEVMPSLLAEISDPLAWALLADSVAEQIRLEERAAAAGWVISVEKPGPVRDGLCGPAAARFIDVLLNKSCLPRPTSEAA